MKIRVNNVDLGYDDHGVGQPVIFLHAFPLNRTMWEGQMTALLNEQQFRLVALDWRGFGESELNTDVSMMEMFADDLAALMDALGMDSAILCALSMGGYAAFAFLRKHPQRVKALVLADTRPGADSEESKANREALAQLAEAEGTEAVANRQVPRLLSDYTRQQHPEVELRVRRMIDAATPAGIAAASRGMAQRSDSSDILTHIACPTLVVVGEQDVLTPPDVAQEYASFIPGAQVAVIPNAGHLSNLEQPEAFFDVLRNFLLLIR